MVLVVPGVACRSCGIAAAACGRQCGALGCRETETLADRLGSERDDQLTAWLFFSRLLTPDSVLATESGAHSILPGIVSSAAKRNVSSTARVPRYIVDSAVLMYHAQLCIPHAETSFA